MAAVAAMQCTVADYLWLPLCTQHRSAVDEVRRLSAMNTHEAAAAEAAKPLPFIYPKNPIPPVFPKRFCDVYEHIFGAGG